MTGKPTELQGQIERILYRNEENNFTVFTASIYGFREPVTCLGSLINPAPGEVVKMTGEWANHPKFGRQFKISFCHSATPATVQGMERYLASGLIRGIGPVMAKRIVKRFREKTLDIIERAPEELLSVEGVGEKRLAMIVKAWEEQKEIRSVMLFLQSHGIGSGLGARIFKQYGNRSIEVVKGNPYRLAMEIPGIGFITADKIAGNMGFAKDSPLRAEAGIIYLLNELTGEGHVYYPYEDLLCRCQEILDIERAIIGEAILALAQKKRIVLEYLTGFPGDSAGFFRGVYLAGYHLAETQLARRLKTLIQTPGPAKRIEPEKAIGFVEKRMSIKLAEGQKEAVKAAARSKVLVITGGPGTGKTTIIRGIIEIFAAGKTKILLAAPTGRAAKRMSEATGLEAKTIHRLLEYSTKQGGFKKNEQWPLDCGLLILDEVSMVDTLLMHYLLKALPPACSLILVGDANQLPSVGAGNVFKDILDSGVVTVVTLREIFRQAKESSIITNAHRIREGRLPDLPHCSANLDDFYFIDQEDPKKNLDLIISLVKDRIPKRFGLDPREDIQVLTPMNRGYLGTDNLNLELQKALNPGTGGIARWGRFYRINDKVMQIRNDYEKEVFNGDIGTISALDEEGGEITVLFDGRKASYDLGDLDDLVHAYAISIHKAQGSEYRAVVIPMVTQHYLLLKRNLVYTAVTRGKKLVVMVGAKKALAIAVKNNSEEKRHTYLKERLAETGGFPADFSP